MRRARFAAYPASIMFSLRVGEVMERGKLAKAAPGMSVARAARLMARKRVGAVLIVEGKRLSGIFTERDALFRVIAEGRDAAATRLVDVMTRDPKSIDPRESFGVALLAMHENGFRHLPVVEEGVAIGIVSMRSALDPDLEEFRSEQERHRHIQRQKARAREAPRERS
jgi:CBS domain-containing protein